MKGSVEKMMARLNQMNDNTITHDVLNQGRNPWFRNTDIPGLLEADEGELSSILRFEDVKLIVPRLLSLINSKESGYVLVSN